LTCFAWCKGVWISRASGIRPTLFYSYRSGFDPRREPMALSFLRAGERESERKRDIRGGGCGFPGSYSPPPAFFITNSLAPSESLRSQETSGLRRKTLSGSTLWDDTTIRASRSLSPRSDTRRLCPEHARARVLHTHEYIRHAMDSGSSYEPEKVFLQLMARFSGIRSVAIFASYSMSRSIDVIFTRSRHHLTPQPEVVSLVARRRLAASLPLTPARLFACPHQRDQCVLLPRFVPTLPFSPRPLAARLFLPRLLRLRAELKARLVSLSKLHTLTLLFRTRFARLLLTYFTFLDIFVLLSPASASNQEDKKKGESFGDVVVLRRRCKPIP